MLWGSLRKRMLRFEMFQNTLESSQILPFIRRPTNQPTSCCNGTGNRKSTQDQKGREHGQGDQKNLTVISDWMNFSAFDAFMNRRASSCARCSCRRPLPRTPSSQCRGTTQVSSVAIVENELFEKKKVDIGAHPKGKNQTNRYLPKICPHCQI